MIFLEKITATGIFSRREMPQEFSRENCCAKMVRNGNTCCVIWSEPYVPAAYSSIPFLPDVLAVPFFVEEACCRGAQFMARDATFFSRIMIMPLAFSLTNSSADRSDSDVHGALLDDKVQKKCHTLRFNKSSPLLCLTNL